MFNFGFSLRMGGNRPPILDKLLAWYKGNAFDGLRIDSYKTPGDFPMDLKQSFCLDADGTTDSGVTSIDHGTLVSYGGTSTVTYSGTSLSMTAGTLWLLEFSDGTIYPLAEGSGATCFSTDGLHSIALTSGNLTALRSGRQDEYHHNVTGGWWEKSGDSVKYPYAVAGFTEYHKPNTWNGAETKQSFKQTQVATFDGTVDKIAMSADHGTIVSFSGTSTPTYAHPDITFTAGNSYNIEFSDGVIIPLNEGSGSNIHDSQGNIVGTVTSGNLTDFWANKITPQALLDMDAPYELFTDATTKDVKLLTQDEIEGKLTLDVASVSFTTPDPLNYLKLTTVDGSDWYMDGQWYPSDVNQSHAAGTDIKIGVPEGVSIYKVYLWNNYSVTDLTFDISQTGWDLTGGAYFGNTAVTGDISQTGWNLTVTAYFNDTAITGDISQTGWDLAGNAYFNDTGVTGDISQTGWNLTGSAYFGNCSIIGDISQTGWNLTGIAHFSNTAITGDISQTGWSLTVTAYFSDTAITGDISQTGWSLTVTAHFGNTGVTGDISQTGWDLAGSAYFYNTAITGDISQTGWDLAGSAYFYNSSNITTASSATTLFGPSCLNIRFDGCALTVASVDNILQAVDFLGGLSGTLQLQGGTNGIPTSTGLTAKTNLEGKGWTVTVNS